MDVFVSFDMILKQYLHNLIHVYLIICLILIVEKCILTIFLVNKNRITSSFMLLLLLSLTTHIQALLMHVLRRQQACRFPITHNPLTQNL